MAEQSSASHGMDETLDPSEPAAKATAAASTPLHSGVGIGKGSSSTGQTQRGGNFRPSPIQRAAAGDEPPISPAAKTAAATTTALAASAVDPAEAGATSSAEDVDRMELDGDDGERSFPPSFTAALARERALVGPDDLHVEPGPPEQHRWPSWVPALLVHALDVDDGGYPFKRGSREHVQLIYSLEMSLHSSCILWGAAGARGAFVEHLLHMANSRLAVMKPSCVDPPEDQGNDSPLMCAMRAAEFEGQARVVKLLLRHGADIDRTCRDGQLPRIECNKHIGSLLEALRDDEPPDLSGDAVALGTQFSHLLEFNDPRDIGQVEALGQMRLLHTILMGTLDIGVPWTPRMKTATVLNLPDYFCMDSDGLIDTPPVVTALASGNELPHLGFVLKKIVSASGNQGCSFDRPHKTLNGASPTQQTDAILTGLLAELCGPH